jgi:hypothetical protein
MNEVIPSIIKKVTSIVKIAPAFCVKSELNPYISPLFKQALHYSIVNPPTKAALLNP